MSSGSLARRYARALLALGLEDKNLEQLGKEVRSLAAAIGESPELAEALSNPAFARSDRETILVAVLEKLKAKKTTVNFTRLLLDRDRVGALPDISRELDAMIDDHAGRVRAQVTSAKPLTSAQLSRLIKALEKLSGKKILVETLEDASLLGGVVAQVGDQVYDGSLRTQLRQMRSSLVN